MKAEFRLLQHPDQAFDGRLKSLDRAVDSKSRTVTARIVVTNHDGMLKPGMVGRASILRHMYAKRLSFRLRRWYVCKTAFRRWSWKTASPAAYGLGGRDQLDGQFAHYRRPHQGDKLVVTGAFQVSDGTKVSF